MNFTEREKWTEALRSDEYKQTTGHLRDSTGFCCLGVYLDVRDPIKWKNDGYYFYWDGKCNSFPIDIEKEIDISSYDQGILIKMNDDQGKDFHEIAEYIEENL